MRIVSMCTPNYNKWLHIFYTSIRVDNPEIEIIIYLINYDDEMASKVESFMPDVQFIRHIGDFDEHQGKLVVTPLKGQFLKEVGGDVLWVDITALIRTKLTFDFNNHDIILVNREGIHTHCAEIFGFSDNSKHLDIYVDECNKENGWYTDQEALKAVDFGKVLRLKFGDYCNFEYDDNALTWSDRGMTGRGSISDADKLYEFDKFVKDLETRVPGYNILPFLDTFKYRPKVMLFTDDKYWCFLINGMAIAEKLKYDFEITLVRKVDLDRDIMMAWEGDLIWCRCSALRARKLWAFKPEYKDRTICSLTTGGHIGINRCDSHMGASVGNPAVVVQNSEMKAYLSKLCPDQEVCMIPNGVDTEKFKPKKFNTGPITVGFAGRCDKASDKIKGYTEFFLNPVKKLNIPYNMVNSTENRVEHDEMPAFYNSIDVLIQMSEYEGCSNTLQEAMASGVPCIITKTGYHGESCDKTNAMVIKRKEEEVIKAVNILKNNDVRRSMSKAARKYSIDHNLYSTAIRFRDLFNRHTPKDL